MTTKNKIIQGDSIAEYARLAGQRDTGFRFSHSRSMLFVSWGGYSYDIEMRRIPTPLALLEWVRHICEKDWDGATPERIGYLIQAVCAEKGWDLFDEVPA